MNVLVPVLVVLLFITAGLVLLARRWRRLAASESRILLSGGGTGGHVHPALAIAEGIRKREPDARFLYVGVKGKAETVIVRRAGYTLRFVSSEGFPGLRPTFRSFRFLCRLCIGVMQSVVIVLQFAPRWVIATGGYVSAPIIFAMLILKTLRLSSAKVFLHEQNSIPGQLNGLLGRWVDRVLLTFAETLSFFPMNGVVVGYPIRHSIVSKPREEAIANLGFPMPGNGGRQVVFAFGGSQGARTINRALVDALRYLIPHRHRLFVIHGTGLSTSSIYNASADTEGRLHASYTPEELELIDEFYYRQDYFHNIADVYSISDLVVCRSGAGSLNEISRLCKPALLIPKVNLPGDHQVMNARAMRQSGAAEVLFEDTIVEDGEVLEKLDGEVLAERVMRLLSDPARLREMSSHSEGFLRRNAIERIQSELYQDRSYNNGMDRNSIPFRPLWSNQQLLQRLSGAYNRAPAGYDPLAVVKDADDLDYYRHRAAGLLSHQSWPDRNLGVKLIGLTHYRGKIPTLLHMLVDRTPVSWVKRCFGGDFYQVGFIRRNIVHTIQVMGHLDSEVERHLLIAASDPYFEVRSQVCRAIGHFANHLAGKEAWLEVLLKLTRDHSFEVVVEAAKALGEVGVDGRALDALLAMKENYFWQIRDAALHGLNRLIERGIITPSDDLLDRVSSFVLTATDFRPHFPIKQTYKTIYRCCHERSAGEKPGEEPILLPDPGTRKRSS